MINFITGRRGVQNIQEIDTVQYVSMLISKSQIKSKITAFHVPLIHWL